jgi:hypothetical protein
MSSSKCLDALLLVSIASFVTITLPVVSTVIVDYYDTKAYSPGICDGTTIQNYNVGGGWFYHGTANVMATVNNTEYASLLYYPPIKHWQLGFLPKMGVDDWYDSLNKTGTFVCYVDINHSSHRAICTWYEITGYYAIFLVCLFMVAGWSAVACTVFGARKKRHYITLPDDLPPPYTRTYKKPATQSLYSSLNDELTTISV